MTHTLGKYRKVVVTMEGPHEVEQALLDADSLTLVRAILRSNRPYLAELSRSIVLDEVELRIKHEFEQAIGSIQTPPGRRVLRVIEEMRNG